MLGDDDMVGDDKAASARYVRRMERTHAELARLRGEPVKFPFVVEDADGDSIEIDVARPMVWVHAPPGTVFTPDRARALARAIWQAAGAAEGGNDD